MAGIRLGEPAQRVQRPLDPIRAVAENVDRALGELQPSGAFGQQGHRGTGPGQPNGCDQSGDAGSDHHDAGHHTTSS